VAEFTIRASTHIPEPLWALAAELAIEHGVFRTAQVLRLNYSKLKQLTLAAAPAEPGSRRSRRRARSVPSRQSGRRAAPPAAEALLSPVCLRVSSSNAKPRNSFPRRSDFVRLSSTHTVEQERDLRSSCEGNQSCAGFLGSTPETEPGGHRDPANGCFGNIGEIKNNQLDRPPWSSKSILVR